MAGSSDPTKKRRGPSIPGGGKRKNRDTRKAQRRLEAEARQAIFDALPEDEKALRRGK